MSHCGSNSIYESLLNKVPIVACPGFADQLGNAVRIENAGVGRIARGGLIGVEEALRDVLFSEELVGDQSSSYKARCERLCEILATHGGAKRAAVIIEDAGRFRYDYMVPNVCRTKLSHLALCAVALSGVVTALLVTATKGSSGEARAIF